MSHSHLAKLFYIALLAVGLTLSPHVASARAQSDAHAAQTRAVARKNEQQHFGNYDGYYHMPDRPNLRRYRYGYPPYGRPVYPYYGGRYFYGGYPYWRTYPYGYTYPYSYPYYGPYYWYF